MMALAAACGFLGISLVLWGGPLWAAQIRNVFRGPEYVPLRLLAASATLGLGLALLGVTAWLLGLT